MGHVRGGVVAVASGRGGDGFSELGGRGGAAAGPVDELPLVEVVGVIRCGRGGLLRGRCGLVDGADVADGLGGDGLAGVAGVAGDVGEASALFLVRLAEPPGLSGQSVGRNLLHFAAGVVVLGRHDDDEDDDRQVRRAFVAVVRGQCLRGIEEMGMLAAERQENEVSRAWCLLSLLAGTLGVRVGQEV